MPLHNLGNPRQLQLISISKHQLIHMPLLSSLLNSMHQLIHMLPLSSLLTNMHQLIPGKLIKSPLSFRIHTMIPGKLLKSPLSFRTLTLILGPLRSLLRTLTLLLSQLRTLTQLLSQLSILPSTLKLIHMPPLSSLPILGQLFKLGSTSLLRRHMRLLWIRTPPTPLLISNITWSIPHLFITITPQTLNLITTITRSMTHRTRWKRRPILTSPLRFLT